MLLQEDYDVILGSSVRTVLNDNILYMMFGSAYQSAINTDNPKKDIYNYNSTIQKNCNRVLSNTRPNRILLAGIGGGTVLTGINPNTPTIIDCIDTSRVVINHFKKYFFPIIKKHINPNIKIKIHCISFQDFITNNKNHLKYDSVIIDCFKIDGFDKSIYGILDQLNNYIYKGGNILTNIHSARTGIYSTQYKKFKQSINRSIWLVYGHLPVKSHGENYNNLIVELKHK